MISILMSSYNYETYMGEAIRSVLKQTWVDFELLVIDDGSKDGSMALARSFAEHDPRVRVLQHPDGKNHGLPETLSLGIAEAGGDWIAFLESDDLWEPECLERRMELARQTKADVVLNAIRPLPMPGAGTGWFDIYVPRVMREHERRAIRSGGAYSLQSSLPAGLFVCGPRPPLAGLVDLDTGRPDWIVRFCPCPIDIMAFACGELQP